MILDFYDGTTNISPWLKDASTLRCVYLGGCHNWGEDDKSLRYVRVKSEKRLILGAMLDTKMVTGSLRHVYHAKPGKTRAPWCWHQPHHRDTWTARYNITMLRLSLVWQLFVDNNWLIIWNIYISVSAEVDILLYIFCSPANTDWLGKRNIFVNLLRFQKITS